MNVPSNFPKTLAIQESFLRMDFCNHAIQHKPPRGAKMHAGAFPLIVLGQSAIFE
jgi:hypothetical protein